MTVCFVTSRYPPAVGGVAVSSMRVVSYLAAAGYRVHVVATCPATAGPPYAETSVEADTVVHRLTVVPDSTESQFFVRAYVRRLDADVRFDLFHAFFLTSVPACAAVAAAGDRPLVASIRGSDAVWLIRHPVIRRMVFSGLRRAAWLTSVNPHLIDEVAPHVGLEGRSSVIRSSAPPPTPGGWRTADATRGVVGTTGDFRPVKDIPLLVRAYAAVPAMLRRQLLLCGAFSHAQEEAWSRTLAREFGLDDEITVTGRYPHAAAPSMLVRMHVYALTSAWEGMPNGLLEAAAAGVPIVATASPGIAGLVEDGRHGLLVPHGDPRALGGALSAVLGDDDLRPGSRRARGRWRPPTHPMSSGRRGSHSMRDCSESQKLRNRMRDAAVGCPSWRSC
ncbi:MAG: glycosyltransferase family 4 protein [Vicinamibacterales bacterium]